MLYTGFMLDKPAVVRYPRGAGPGVEIEEVMSALPIGKAELRRQGKGIAILAFGSMLAVALEVGEQLDATVINMRFIKPIDTEMIIQMAQEYDLLVTVEENTVQGGAGSAVTETLTAHGITQAVLQYGLPDEFIPHGDRQDMLNDAGMTAQGLSAFILGHLQKHETGKAAKTA